MANLNIKLNAYFTQNLPERMLNAYDESSEALWFTSHDVLEYIESVGVKKESYIGLSSGPHLYIKANGRTIGFMDILELCFSWDICPGMGLLDHMVVLFLVFLKNKSQKKSKKKSKFA